MPAHPTPAAGALPPAASRCSARSSAGGPRKPDSVRPITIRRGEAAIHLCDLPGERPGPRTARNRDGQPDPHSLFGLAPHGVCHRLVPSPDERCALTAPFHPCRPCSPEARNGLRNLVPAVCSLLHFPSRRRALPLASMPSVGVRTFLPRRTHRRERPHPVLRQIGGYQFLHVGLVAVGCACSSLRRTAAAARGFRASDSAPSVSA